MTCNHTVTYSNYLPNNFISTDKEWQLNWKTQTGRLYMLCLREHARKWGK